MPRTVNRYSDGGDIIEVSGESPAGFKGVLFLATRNGKEFLITPQQIKRLTPLVEPEVPETVVQYEPQTQTRKPRQRALAAPVVEPDQSETPDWYHDLWTAILAVGILGSILYGVLA